MYTSEVESWNQSGIIGIRLDSAASEKDLPAVRQNTHCLLQIQKRFISNKGTRLFKISIFVVGYNYQMIAYLIFFPIILIAVTLPIVVILFILILLGKILKKDSVVENLIHLSPFPIVLVTFHFLAATVWDLFVEGKGKLFHYWDQLPWMGFYLFKHDQPATRTLNQDLAPGITLETLDLIWLVMLIAMYGSTLVFCWLLFWRKSSNTLVYAIVIVLILFVLGMLSGFNKRGLVL